MKFQIEVMFSLSVLRIRIRPTRHSKAQNANFVLPKYWVHPSHYYVRILIPGYHAEIVYKNATFLYTKAIFHVMGSVMVPKIFMVEKYGILVFKWHVVSIFITPRLKVFSKKQKGHD